MSFHTLNMRQYLVSGLGHLRCKLIICLLVYDNLIKLRRDLITMFQYLKGGYKEDEDSLFTRSHVEKRRDNGSSQSGGDSSWTQEENFSQ